FDSATIRVDPVSSSSGQKIGNAMIRRALGIERGDWYSDRAIVQAQRNLFQLGTYQHIDVAPLPDSLQPPGDTLIVLAVRLTEDYMRQVDSEFGWATLDCGRVRLQYTDKNFLGMARRIDVTGQASKLGYGDPVATSFTRDLCTPGKSPLVEDPFSTEMYYFAGLTVRQPQLLGTRVVPSLSLYSERRGEYKAYLRTTDFGADLAATMEVRDRMPLRLAYTFEFGRTEADPPALCVLFNRCDLESQQQISQRARLGVASATLARIRTDNVISPTRGWMMRGEVRTSRLPGTAQTLHFNKATGDLAWYRSLGPQNVLALRLRGGVVKSLASLSDFIPPQERLYAGGPTSVRGFQQNELGSKVYIARNGDVVQDIVVLAPNDTVYRFALRSDSIGFDTDSNPARSVPLGGDALLVANIEYRIRDPFFFPNHLQYTLFLDGGDVWTRDRQPAEPRWSFRDLKWTPGIGFRATTPVGPIQANIAWNRFKREAGPLYYNPDVRILACVSPGTPLDYRKDPNTGQLVTTGDCGQFEPPKRERWFQKLTFTFSIGPDF
ncbi:MAG: BamA/TamA family outer membrane protein, partial [Gemmatimonadaceae bacterium]